MVGAMGQVVAVDDQQGPLGRIWHAHVNLAQLGLHVRWRRTHFGSYAITRQQGAGLAFDTDAPVERVEPLASLYAATTRQGPRGEPAGGWYPAQCISLEEAVRAYTAGSAAAERSHARRGTLSACKDADLVVLSADPFRLPLDALRSIQVELTMLGGRIIFDGLSSWPVS